jgi:hypothetical protein
MKINELIGFKKDTAYQAAVDMDSDPDEGYTAYSKNSVDPIVSRLESLGWNLIGKGYEALVFANTNKSYVIKLFIPWGNSVDFLKFIINNQSNPHVPKLRGKPVKIKPGSSVYIARMERLAPISSETDPIFSQYLPSDQNSVWDLFEPNNAKWIQENNPELYTLIKFINNSKNEPDLHLENIMKRRNTLVFIDF